MNSVKYSNHFLIFIFYIFSFFFLNAYLSSNYFCFFCSSNLPVVLSNFPIAIVFYDAVFFLACDFDFDFLDFLEIEECSELFYYRYSVSRFIFRVMLRAGL